MKIKKIIFGAISCGLLLSTISYISPNLVEINSKADTTSQNSGKGEIVVKYVDQNGNVIRPATTVMGKTGSTYVASIPKIPGYTYSSIENGENNNDGPQMIFGGDDPSTNILEMSIVYKSTGNSSNNSDSSSSNSNNGTTVSPAKSSNNKNASSNSNSSNPNKNSDTSNSSGTTKKANSATGNNNSSATSNNDSSNKKNTSENNGDSSANKANNGKNNNSDDKVNKNAKTNDKKSNKNQNKVDDDNSKNKDKEKTHKNNIFWIIGGIILVVIAGVAFAWHKMRKPRHYEH